MKLPQNAEDTASNKARARAIDASLTRCRRGCGALLWPREVEGHKCKRRVLADLRACDPCGLEASGYGRYR